MASTSIEPTLFGLLLVDKPIGPTSHDIVQLARRDLGERRIGHTGTLDPFASGLLLLCVGRATRLVDYYHALPKTYTGVVRIGSTTTTDDETGEVTASSDAWQSVNRADVESAVASLVGVMKQRPPAFSAIKVAGRRAHREARAGRPVELEAREVTIHDLSLIDSSPPDLKISAVVSTGTYIRAVARDLGEILGCGAHLAGLRRTEIGPFEVSAALVPADFGGGPRSGASWRSGSDAVPWMAMRLVDDDEASRIGMGQWIERGVTAGPAAGGIDVDRVALVHGDRLLAIGRIEGDRILPEKVFHAS